MSVWKLLSLTVTFVAQARAASECQPDDVALLQEKTLSHVSLGAQSQDSAKIPDLSSLKDAFGNVMDKVSDFANKGVEEVTGKLGTVLESADKEVTALATKCNESLKAFDAAADINATVGENITRLKTLVGSTVGQMGPLYDSTSSQVSSGFEAAKTLLKPIGLDDEAEKLSKCADTVTGHLSTLKEKAQAAIGDLEEATEENLDPTLDKMTGKLGDAKAAVADFTGKFDDTFNDFVSSFVKAVTSKLPAGQQETLGSNIKTSAKSMQDKVHALCKDLKSMVDDVSSGAEKSALSIRKEVAQVSPGFFGSIGNFFKNMFHH